MIIAKKKKLNTVTPWSPNVSLSYEVFSNRCPLKFYSSPRGATTAWTGQGSKAWHLYKDFNYYSETNLDSILKSRYIILLAKVCIVKAMVFLLVVSGCESWTHKEGWALKKWCFWTVVWRRLLRVPWTARRSNQSILKEISPEYSLEGLLLKLTLQSFGHLMQRTNSLEKTPMLGKFEGKRRRGWKRMMVR